MVLSMELYSKIALTFFKSNSKPQMPQGFFSKILLFNIDTQFN